ncbi:MAG: HlyC/CorC family transporter [Chitinophagaceae bacterium]|nr:HlyC/CorC family transporter [Chitinophagaceae bacterium]
MDVFVIVAICVAILFIAFFSGIEVAFATANRLGIELKKKQGASSAILLSRLFDEPSRFIGTVIVGFNFFLVTFVLLVSAFWNLLLNHTGITSSLILPLRLMLEILLSMIVVIIIGEFIPKAIFRTKSDALLSFSARSGLLGLAHDIFYPVASLFVKISQWILTIIFDMRIDKKKDSFSRADLENFFQQTKEFNEEGQDLNTDLFEAALSLHKVKVRECLIPRKEIEGVLLSSGIEDLRKKFVDTRLSKLLVYDGNIDQIVGYVHQLDLFKAPKSIKEILLPIPAIPESMSATDLISKFSRERKSIAWVVDEFGGTSGIVTMEDMLEEIFGEIKDEYDVEEFEEKKISDTEYILSGRLELDHLIEKYGLEFPDESSETLSGFIIHQYEAIPKLKERIIINDYEFEILHVSDTRIEMVRLKILQ